MWDSMLFNFGVSVRTVQEWEQRRRTPMATARNFLKVIKNNPAAVQVKCWSYFCSRLIKVSR